MGGATRVFGREPERADHPIGLGWLLAIALCGGILLFTTIGLLLVWWVKKTRSPGPRMVYGYAAATTTETSFMPPTSTSRLIKRRLLGGGGGSGSLSKLSSRLSSRFSLGPPAAAAAPSLPTHNNEGFALPERRRTVSRGRKRSRSWVDEDDLHGPRISRSKRSARDSWFGVVPTLPSVEGVLLPEVAEMMEEESSSSSRRVHVVGAGVPLQHPQPRWIPRSQTEPGLMPMAAASSVAAYPVELPTGNVPAAAAAAAGPVRMQAPQVAHMRPSATDSNLKGILRSTEMRLSDRNSRPPTKVSRSSATRGSPTKGHRNSLSARSSNGFPLSGSPPKNGLPNTTSMSSIGSAANSLIAAATQELELPGRSSSPSKAKGVRFEEQLSAIGDLEKPQYKTVLSQSPQTHSPQRQFSQMALIHHPSTQSVQQHPPPQRSPDHRMSFDSDKSSSLSTLYSTNEPEEDRPGPRLDYDPFVEKGAQGRWPNWQSRQRLAQSDSQRRAKTLSSASLTRIIMGEPAGPPPLRPLSAISQPDMAYGGLMSPLMLDSQAVSFARDAVTDGLAPPQTPYLNQVPSEVSFVSMSVDSDATEVPASEVPKADWHDSSDSASSSPTTPTGQSRFPDMSSSSSPYDEREIMSLLMATAPPQRALPLPPPSITGTDGALVAVLSPTPGSRLARRGSNASSVYTFDTFLAEQSTALAPSPSRRSIIHPIIDGPRLSSTIAELRRMNSVLSTYSVASIASTVAEGDSPTLPASLSGSGSGLAKSRSVLFGPASIGSRHYLNVGNTRSLASSGSRRFGPRGSRHRRAETCYYGKDSSQGLGLGLRLACIVDETVDAEPQRRTQSLVCDPGMEVLEGVAPLRTLINQKLGPVEELIAAERRLDTHRASVESLGLYDKDGFLMSSPERDAKRRGLRI
ncbi:hypothetical protein M419DRAFT_34700 [Trichoderma reesei RUT C-30]|uniref:Uncharacterized protein n=1 Tax=Hypocrea jecorina (strain ATCC 56765 / BCRC 32924 / NRRL 11460 / Rut C-30) TaxID=1344414 RepID=A0A024SCG7_HYPJR|nr:hypothetical protein M419DRAFT_34700 [Trichoderma reesei RUT C-30]